MRRRKELRWQPFDNMYTMYNQEVEEGFYKYDMNSTVLDNIYWIFWEGFL